MDNALEAVPDIVTSSTDMHRTLLTLGVIYMLEHTACAKRECNDCPDVMQEMYRALKENGVSEDFPVQFEWERSLRIIVTDPLQIAEKSPALSKSLNRLYHDGFDVVYLTQTREV